MSRPVEKILAHLANVKQTGSDRWLASCPTAAHEHGDRHPSLGIRECGDGTVLMRCYSIGCTAEDVVRALDLRIRDLFPDGRSDRVRASESPRIPYRDLLHVLRVEAMVAAVAASDAAPHLKAGDAERAMLAAHRIRNALTIAGVRS